MMKNEKARIAVIGLGGRGIGLLHPLKAMKDIEITGLCDLYQDRIDNAKKVIGHDAFSSTDYNEIIGRDDVDIVLVSTSWQAHIDVSVDALNAGKFVGMEVGGVYDVNECFRLIEACRGKENRFMLLENCCFGQRELMCKIIAEKGHFGKLSQLNGGYCHDLRNEVSFGKENRHYRLEHYKSHNCDNYPTHDLGPISKILKINEGNSFEKLISVAGPSLGLHEYISQKKSDNEELLNTEFAQADTVTTLIKCKNGEIVRLTLQTTLPRHYSRDFSIYGTKGMYQEEGDIMILEDFEDASKYEFQPHKLYHTAEKYEKKFDHPYWRKTSRDMMSAGHGGMDWLVLREMVESFRNNRKPYVDVFDAAVWMSVTALSEQSIKNGSVWVDFPAF